MAEVNLLIAGKSYRMACDDGQEPHLQGLAEQIDGKIADMRESFGEIGDMRLTVMASIVVADELAEARRRIKALEGDIERLRNADDNALAANEAEQDEAAKLLDRVSERLEVLAADLRSQTHRTDLSGANGHDDLS
ncbi:cell division protein ZapA [Flaviflagellibacter deserti]|jgi:cell division protein ZapA|uniref:Cell division protein ZapA n=1 Tax=Flaviflagellibacter deserti TaxID=2267266 RepID=A0ABV9YUA8_9HYPH